MSNHIENKNKITEHTDAQKILIIQLLQADRGCAAGAIFWGAGGVGVLDGCYAPRATDFREERSPPQADSIVSVF